VSDNPVPSVQAILLCEKIIEEAGTGKKSLIGIFTGISTVGFPCQMAMAIYARLTDGEGVYHFRFDLVHLPTDKKVASATLPPLQSADRLSPMEVVVQIPAIQFAEPGKYEFQMYANDVFLGHASADLILKGEVPNASS
jgi:hypothetical protein